MGNCFPLYSLYQKQIDIFNSRSPLDVAIQALSAGQKVDLEPILDVYPAWEDHLSEEKIIKNWENLLILTLLSYLTRSHPNPVFAQFRFLLHEPWNESSQYLRALVALNHFLVGLPAPEVHPCILEGGAVLIDKKEYCPWLALPYLPYHTEFGVLLCLLVSLVKQDNLRPMIERLARWQLNTLDVHFLPLPGLFTQEKDSHWNQHLLWAYLFFQGAAYLTGERQFATVAQAQLNHLEQLISHHPFEIPLLVLLLERLGEKEPLKEVPFQLLEDVYDPSTALIGKRYSSYQAICTLHGDHTGLGCFRLNDVEVVNYGPQYLPLGDCQGFGIEGNHISDHGLRKPILCLKRQGFSLKGCIRLVDQPFPQQSSSLFKLGQFHGIWFEIEQELKDKQLAINASLLGISGWESVAFSFFVKAQICQINSQLSLYPRTFDRYQGDVQPLILKGEQGVLRLNLLSPSGTMQVIPLGGGTSFWGADFLIAYLLDSHQRHYHWQLA